ncbi:hypothetical protein HK099_000598, partial [Clydaea vesicula]
MKHFYILSGILIAVSAYTKQIPFLNAQTSERKFPDARSFLNHVNKVFSDSEFEINQASWNYNTNITEHNQKVSTDIEIKANEVLLKIIEEAKQYEGETEDEKRQLLLISLKSGTPSSREDQRRLSELQAKMTEIYSTAKVDGHTLEPDLTETLATSRDYDTLLKAYIGFRDATGPKIKPMYEEFIKLMNVGAKENNFDDAGALWRAGYDMGDLDFVTMMEKVWQQVLPLYEQIHCYTKYKLSEKYEKVDENKEFIPAHLLGNMWSQDFSNIYSDILIPFPDVTPVEITPELVKQKLLSAWDFGNNDLRIKMCTAVTGEELLTIHHEQGHLYYDHYYSNQPSLYRESAADFFHEAIGDTMVLSVVVPEHLQEIGLLKGKLEKSLKQTINAQMAVALSKIAVLPWAYMVDLYRWKLFAGVVTKENYQSEWENLMKKYQGIERPIPGVSTDFDAGAKYHVPANTPYVRYFGAAVIQFQFHESLCKVAGHTGPLHECSIYKNLEAGNNFKNLLSLGRSKTWQEAVNIGTNGQYDTLDGQSLIKYFAPLMDWLKEENKGKTCGWGD